jgi:hypothetical protein
MRISSLEDDSGHDAYQTAVQHGGKIRVFLDDVEQDKVLIADEEEGFIERYALDEDGKIILPNHEPVPPLTAEDLEGLTEAEVDAKIVEHEAKEQASAEAYEQGIAKERLTGTVRIQIDKSE